MNESLVRMSRFRRIIVSSLLKTMQQQQFCSSFIYITFRVLDYVSIVKCWFMRFLYLVGQHFHWINLFLSQQFLARSWVGGRKGRWIHTIYRVILKSRHIHISNTWSILPVSRQTSPHVTVTHWLLHVKFLMENIVAWRVGTAPNRCQDVNEQRLPRLLVSDGMFVVGTRRLGQ